MGSTIVPTVNLMYFKVYCCIAISYFTHTLAQSIVLELHIGQGSAGSCWVLTWKVAALLKASESAAITPQSTTTRATTPSTEKRCSLRV